MNFNKDLKLASEICFSVQATQIRVFSDNFNFTKTFLNIENFIKYLKKVNLFLNCSLSLSLYLTQPRKLIRLRSKFLFKRSHEDQKKKKCSEQQHFTVSLLRKTKNYYSTKPLMKKVLEIIKTFEKTEGAKITQHP